jgi:tryptophan synthase alpha chain
MIATRIDRCFARLRDERRKGFIAYITAGDPSLAVTQENVVLLERAGVDLIELGIPFSDPVADGRVNQAAAERALRSGTTYQDILECVRSIRHASEIPILFFSYLNPLLARGFERTARGAAEAGVDGFLILDLPPEEISPYAAILEHYGLNHVCLVAPTSPPDRIRQIVRAASGFVYCVSREGVTGKQAKLAAGARRLLRRVRRFTTLPLALGFGISTPAQAKAAAREADAVVVGSAIVEALAASGRDRAARRRTAGWIGDMVKAVKQV